VNTYTCTYGIDWPSDIVAETPSKARYKYYLSLDIDERYSEVFRWLRSKLKHKFEVSDLYGNQYQFESMCKSRFIEFAFIGMKVEHRGKQGVIVGANCSQNLDVCFDGNYHSDNCHPYFEMKYFDNKGELIAIDGKLVKPTKKEG